MSLLLPICDQTQGDSSIYKNLFFFCFQLGKKQGFLLPKLKLGLEKFCRLSLGKIPRVGRIIKDSPSRYIQNHGVSWLREEIREKGRIRF